MRLPWPFGHRTSPGGSPSTGSGEGVAGSASASGASGGPTGPAGGAGVPAAPPTGAWASLPPIQRTAGAAPLVAPSRPFLAGVPGHTPLPPIVQPLGHEASPAAPAGLVVAHARTVPALTSRAELPTRPVQRRAVRGSGQAFVVADAIPDAEPAPEPGARVAAPAASAAPEPEPEPVRRLAAVPREATVTPPARPLTQSAPALVPVGKPVVSRALAEPASQAGPSAALALPRRRPGLGAPIQRETDHSLAEPPTAGGRWTERAATTDHAPGGHGGAAPSFPVAGPAAAGRVPAAPGLAVRPRRPGLGAPISVPPATAVAQRSPSAGSTPATGSAPAGPGGARGATPGASTAAGPAPVAGGQAHTAARALPVLPVARRRRDDGTGDTPATAPAATTPARGSGPVTLPTVGARPLRPSLSAQRSAAPSGADAEPAETPVAARWASPEPLPNVVTALPPTGGAGSPAGGADTVQLSPAGVADAPGPAGPPPAVREITFPAPETVAEASIAGPAGLDVQRTVAGTSARPAAPVAGNRPRHPVAAATAGHATQARAADHPLTLARTPAPEPARVAAPVASSSGAGAPRAGWIVADPASPSAPPTVQMSRPTSGGIPVASFTATPVVQREEAAAPAAAPESRTPTDAELEELARKLFGRIRGQLRAEVMHEREAKGLSFDAF